MRTSTVVVLAALAACTPRTAPPAQAGKRIAEGRAIALAPSPDGSRLAWLGSCPEAGKGPPGCALFVAPAEGGPAVRVADGVAAFPGAFGWTSGGALVALARRNPGTGSGDLVIWRVGAEPRVLAAGATSFASGAGLVAWSAGGEVHVLGEGADVARLAGGAGAFEVAVAPAPGRAVAARARGADGAPRLLLWRGAIGNAAAVATEAGPFAFSPDGAWLAAVAGIVPGAEGMLVAIPAGSADRPGDALVLGKGVGPFQWAPGTGRLAWLEGFDARGSAGRLVTARPGEGPVVLGERVSAFELAPGGGRAAFVRHVTQGGYVARLELSPTGAAEAGTVAQDAAAFAFTADGRWLLYRAECATSGEGCALFRFPAAGLGPAAAPERIADGVAGFAVSPGTGERVLVSFARRDRAGVDLAAWAGGRLVPLDAKVLPGSAVLLPPDGRRAAWIATSAERPGVVVADLP